VSLVSQGSTCQSVYRSAYSARQHVREHAPRRLSERLFPASRPSQVGRPRQSSCRRLAVTALDGTVTAGPLCGHLAQHIRGPAKLDRPRQPGDVPLSLAGKRALSRRPDTTKGCSSCDVRVVQALERRVVQDHKSALDDQELLRPRLTRRVALILPRLLASFRLLLLVTRHHRIRRRDLLHRLRLAHPPQGRLDVNLLLVAVLSRLARLEQRVRRLLRSLRIALDVLDMLDLGRRALACLDRRFAPDLASGRRALGLLLGADALPELLCPAQDLVNVAIDGGRRLRVERGSRGARGWARDHRGGVGGCVGG
ncbi:hypothetical protein DMC30DRAFT_158627, partial [Rhodotorula diobovata]